MYAVLLKNGNLVQDDLSYSDALRYKDWDNELQIIDQDTSSKLSVWYTELGGPWGYGHKEPSFITYGGLTICIIRLYNWMKAQSRVWEDGRELRDYLSHCSLTINGKDYSNWMLKQAETCWKKTFI